jgi:hypothetical protein
VGGLWLSQTASWVHGRGDDKIINFGNRVVCPSFKAEKETQQENTKADSEMRGGLTESRPHPTPEYAHPVVNARYAPTRICSIWRGDSSHARKYTTPARSQSSTGESNHDRMDHGTQHARVMSIHAPAPRQERGSPSSTPNKFSPFLTFNVVPYQSMGELALRPRETPLRIRARIDAPMRL